MAQEETAVPSILTNTEREALERPGLRSRARALAELATFASRMGLSGDVIESLAASIRDMSKQEAAETRRALEELTRLLGGAGLNTEVMIASPASDEDGAFKSSEECLDIPIEIPIPETVAKELVPPEKESLTTEVHPHIGDPLDLLEQRIIDEEMIYDTDRVAHLLSRLTAKGVDLGEVTKQDFNHDMMRQLIAIYCEGVDPKRLDAVRVNIACTWGYLVGQSMEELTTIRAHSKPNATPADISNSRFAFINGIHTASKRRGAPKGTVSDPPKMPTSVTTVLPPEEEIELEEEVEEVPERLRTYQDVVADYIEYLGLDSGYEAAFNSLLHPENNGEMTVSKVGVIEAIRKRIAAYKGADDMILILDGSPRAKGALRQLLGVYTKGNRPEIKDPIPLKEQLKGKIASEKAIYAAELYAVLDELLRLLQSEINDSVKVPLPSKPILQVGFTGSAAHLVES